MNIRNLMVTCLCVFLLAPHCFSQGDIFRFRDNVIKPGERKSFTISVKSDDGDSTYIPITILNGKTKGPVLGLIAGIHGYEYPPIIAMQKMPHQLDPNLIKGTIIIV